jgi:hypothetical protein
MFHSDRKVEQMNAIEQAIKNYGQTDAPGKSFTIRMESELRERMKGHRGFDFKGLCIAVIEEACDRLESQDSTSTD